jgi:hypothetical protein
MTKFKILSSRNNEKIENEVNEKLKEGWTLLNCSATGSHIYAFLLKED